MFEIQTSEMRGRVSYLLDILRNENEKKTKNENTIVKVRVWLD